METHGWNIDGRWIEMIARDASTNARVEVDRVEQEMWVTPDGVECPMRYQGRTFVFTRTARLLSVRARLFVEGEEVPSAREPIEKKPAPSGAFCGSHPTAAATATCVRCGTFSCGKCLGIDGIHCRSCLSLLTTQKLPSDASRLPPGMVKLVVVVVVFAAIGVVVGGSIGARLNGPLGWWIGAPFGAVVGGILGFARERKLI